MRRISVSRSSDLGLTNWVDVRSARCKDARVAATPNHKSVSQLRSSPGTIRQVELRLSLCRLDRRGEGVDVVGAVLAAAVDEDVGVPVTPLEPAESTSSTTRAAPTWRRRSSRNRSTSSDRGEVADLQVLHPFSACGAPRRRR